MSMPWSVVSKCVPALKRQLVTKHVPASPSRMEFLCAPNYVQLFIEYMFLKKLLVFNTPGENVSAQTYTQKIGKKMVKPPSVGFVADIYVLEPLGAFPSIQDKTSVPQRGPG